MNEFERLCMYVLPFLSVVVVCLPIISPLVRFAWYSAMHRDRDERTYRGIKFMTLCVLGAVWCLRLAVGLYSNAFPANPDAVVLTGFEEVFNSFVHALQTLSMDEDYTTYIESGRKMMAMLYGEQSALVWLYGSYASMLNLLAPILGGAFLFDILTDIFPRVHLHITHFMAWRETCYFSELNETSLAMAKSLIAEKSWFFKPVIVFTDAYADRTEEADTELINEAKRCGAICLREDVIHVAKTTWGKRSYYLMDMNEHSNIHTLTELTSPVHAAKIKKAVIYLFISTDAYVRVDRRVREKLLQYEAFQDNEEKLPIIVPVNSYRNLVTNLFVNIPLYEPILDDPKAKTVNLTVLGGGIIGTEAVLAAYWMGQMLDHHVHIQVVAKETEQEFYAKLDYINPEIRRSMEHYNEILRYRDRKSGEDITAAFNTPYCTINYMQADVKSGSFWNTETQEAHQLLGTHYFVVALGNDEDNMEVADAVRIFLGQNRIRGQRGQNTVIAYVVYDTALAATLNLRCRFRSVDPKWEGLRTCAVPKRCEGCKPCDIYMVAFGDLRQVYSVGNIRMTSYAVHAEVTGQAYQHSRAMDIHLDQHRRQGMASFDSYNYWSDLARAMHLKYKVFSVGGMHRSVFNCTNEEQRVKASQKACAAYKLAAVTADRKAVVATGTLPQRIAEERVRLAWLEHRRWNAYMRSRGFRSATVIENGVLKPMIEKYYYLEEKHKNLKFKMHPCLVECPEDFLSVNYLDRIAEEVDRLATATLSEEDRKNRKKTGYKPYDDCSREFDTYYLWEEACRLFPITEKQIDRITDHGRSGIPKEEGKPCYVSDTRIRRFLKKRYKTAADVEASFGSGEKLTKEECAAFKERIASEAKENGTFCSDAGTFLTKRYYRALCRDIREARKKAKQHV